MLYEIGVDILFGNIVWINGPYAAGKYPDIEIFRSDLAHFLDEFERVEADGGSAKGQVPRVRVESDQKSSDAEQGAESI